MNSALGLGVVLKENQVQEWRDEGDQESRDEPETRAWACLWHSHFLTALFPGRAAEGKRWDSVGQQEAFLVRKVQLSFASLGLKMSLVEDSSLFQGAF